MCELEEDPGGWGIRKCRNLITLGGTRTMEPTDLK